MNYKLQNLTLSDCRSAQVRLAEDVELTVRSAAIKDTSVQALLSVRPEKIYITRNKPMKENAFKAVIEEEVFRGAMDELRLRVAGKLELMAMVANESAHERAWHKGDIVYCAIHTDDVIVVEQR